jgi:hypothetical protein
MHDRINDWLDGDLPFEELNEREKAEARALDAVIRSAAERIARVPAPELTESVMANLPLETPRAPAAAGPPSGRSRLRAWLAGVRPARAIAIQPAAALAVLALLIGFALGTLVTDDGPAEQGLAVAAEAQPRLFVRFELEADGASDVRIAGTFTGWEADIELTPLGDGRWTATVPLDPGVHDYVFVLDGDHHIVDPFAPRVPDGFGGYNSRLALVTPEL